MFKKSNLFWFLGLAFFVVGSYYGSATMYERWLVNRCEHDVLCGHEPRHSRFLGLNYVVVTVSGFCTFGIVSWMLVRVFTIILVVRIPAKTVIAGATSQKRIARAAFHKATELWAWDTRLNVCGREFVSFRTRTVDVSAPFGHLLFGAKVTFPEDPEITAGLYGLTRCKPEEIKRWVSGGFEKFLITHRPLLDQLTQTVDPPEVAVYEAGLISALRRHLCLGEDVRIEGTVESNIRTSLKIS